MHNLIMSPALLQILKSPLPDLGNLKKEFAEKFTGSEEGLSASGVGLGKKRKIIGSLNVNASEFVPRQNQWAEANDEVNLSELQRHFEAKDEGKNKPKLTLPWNGFPKSQARQENAGASRNSHIVLVGDEEYLIVAGSKRAKKDKSPGNAEKNVEVKEKSPNDAVGQSKRREQERKVALEALKLAEQRRMREPLVPVKNMAKTEDGTKVTGKPIIHLSRSPVRFNPAERERVNRLRVAKRERIELVLKEMGKERQKKNIPNAGSSKRFISQPQDVTKTHTVSTAMPRRYIPTVKEWDEKCKLKLEKMENKENKLETHNHFKRSTTMPNSSHIPESKLSSNAPKYIPHGQMLAEEKRRDNLTHAGSLPPTIRPVFKPEADRLSEGQEKRILRYTIEQLLQLEPQPNALEKPKISQAMSEFGILRD